METVTARPMAKDDHAGLEAAFRYDPETGVIVRIRAHDTKNIGKAGCVDKKGYVRVVFRGRKLLGHRIAWVMTHGPIPDGYVIDHINGDPSDNRISNLRLALPSQNLRNRKSHSGTYRGLKGVCYDAERGRYRYKIMINGRAEKRGSFDTAEEAALAYDEAARRLHGEFARVNFPATPAGPAPVEPPTDQRSGSALTRSHLRIYRQMAEGDRGVFITTASLTALLDEIDRLELLLTETPAGNRAAVHAGTRRK